MQRPPRPRDVDPETLRAALAEVIEGEVRFDEATRAVYATDASNYRQPPIGVVIPRHRDDVIAAVAVARRHDVPILSRGGGTSLAGQCCNAAVVLDFSKYMHRVLDVDPIRRLARVEPGCILDHLRSQTVDPYRLTYAPDPATHGWCTLGGMIGNNSCGVHSVMAGRTADNVIELLVLTYDGEVLRVGETSDAEREAIEAAGGRRAEIYRDLAALRDRYGSQIRARYPRIPRRVSGYNLDDLLPERGFHLARALVGTEGTCVIVLEATVRLVPDPPCRVLVVLGFDDVCAAADQVPAVLEHAPVALEGIDRTLVDHMEDKGMPLHPELLPPGDGWLIVELGGDSGDAARAKAKRLCEAAADMPGAPSSKVFDDDAQEAQIWHLRESGLGATAHVPGQPSTWPGWEDAAVPPDRLGDYLREFRELLDAHGYQAALYGHFGDGCIHCRIDFHLLDREGIERYKRFAEAAADLVVRYGGSLSGEHGDGQSRGWLLPRMYGNELVDAFRAFKAIWDPEGRMNPGKVVDPAPPDAHLRLGEDYAPKVGRTWYHYPQDEGDFANALLRCVGVGQCRRPDNAFMCPSFVATRDELDTTRGRAHALFEMLNGGVITDGWRSKAVLRALDLCLGCKGCKTECPVNVDLATYKSEFLAHHYRWRLRPRSAYAMGLIGRWARLAMIAPRLANLFGQRRPFSTLLKWLAGVAPARALPRFADERFRSWFDRFRVPDTGTPVVLLPDVFNDCFLPEALRAATRVLTRLGYRVTLPDHMPAIRPALHYGMVARGRRLLRRLVAELTPHARAGVPIVGIEPSTVSVLRDELPALLPHDLDAERVTRHAMLLSELLVRDDVALPSLGGRVLFHPHCHDKAVLDADAAREVLRRMGAEVDEPWPGCCGMAGSFGFEADHYAVSQTIAEQALLPAVRAAGEETLIVVEGFSCHTQIADGTGRRPLHLAELIERAFGGV
ncbi:MAG: FAD-binding and (Fe-S)-binding domain-containing protein [bacterium]